MNQKVFWIRLSIFARTILIKIRPCLTTTVGSSLKEKGNQHINGKRMLHTRIIARSLLLLRKVKPLHLHVVGWYCCMCMVGDSIDSRRIWCGWNVRYVQFYQVMFGILLYIFYSVIHKIDMREKHPSNINPQERMWGTQNHRTDCIRAGGWAVPEM